MLLQIAVFGLSLPFFLFNFHPKYKSFFVKQQKKNNRKK